ncbi:MAG: T9SS type A sorting domain-containing protein [Chitinophagales bacterium]
MKHSIYTFIFVCLFSQTIIFQTKAQSFEHCWQDFFLSAAYDVAYSEYDSTWIVGGQNGNFALDNWPHFDGYISKFDGKGNLLWQVNNLTQWEIGSVNTVLALPDGKILVGGLIGLCDVGPATYLLQMNSDGEALWYKEGAVTDNTTSMSLLPNNRVVLLGISTLSIIDFEGNVIWSSSLNVSSDYHKKSLIITKQGDFLVGGKEFLNLYSKDDGSLLQHQELEGRVSGLASSADNEGYVAIVQNNILQIDTNLQVTNSHNTNFLFEDMLELSLLPYGLLAVLGRHQGQFRVAVLEAKSLILVNDFYLDNPLLVPISIGYSGDLMAIVGGNFSPPYPFSSNYDSFWGLTGAKGTASSFIQVVSPFVAPNIHSVDAGIEAFNFSSADLLDGGSCWFGPYLSQIALKDVELTIRNFGEKPIENIQVNFRSNNSCSNICLSTFTIMEKLNNITIEENETYTFALGDIIIPNKLTQSSYELCFWTSIPNQKIDTNHNNDQYCEILTFTDIEAQNTLSQIQIYPNPTKDLFVIEAPENQSNELQLQLINTQGQILVETHFTQKMEIDVSRYPIGVYLLKVSDGFNSYTEKLLKD